MADYLPKDPDNITVKTSTIESVIAFINNGENDKALEYLKTIIDFEFRAEVRKRKAELLFRVNASVTSPEYNKCKNAYNDFIEKCLF